MKLRGHILVSFAHQVGAVLGIVLVSLVGLLVIRATLKSSLAEAATNTYNPSFCLGGWENPDAAAGKPGKSSANGGPAAAYLAPDVFAQIFCGYFPVTDREKPPKSATVSFKFSLSGQPAVEEPEEEEVQEEPTEEEAEEETEEPVEEPVEEDVEEEIVEEPEEEVSEEEPVEEPVEEPAEEESIEEEAPDEEPEATSFLDFLLPRAHAEEPVENLLVVSYSFDGVRWYAAGRVSVENAEAFSMEVPATMWSDLQNLQVMAAPLPISGERPDIYLESIELEVEADLTLGEIAIDGAAAVGGAVGEVLGLVDTLQTAAVSFALPPPPAPPAPPAKVKKLFYEVAGNPVNAEGAGKNVPHLTLEDDGTTLRVAGECDADYFVILTYRSIEDFEGKTRSFVSNYADECRGDSFTYRMNHLPIDTPEDVYYLVVGEQGDEGSWVATSPLVPIKIGQKEVDPLPSE